MKVLFFLFSIVGVAVVFTKSISETRAIQWKQFKVDFSRSFESIDQENLREKIFWNNLKTISRHNFEFRQGRKLFKMGIKINGYSDMTFEEYSALYKANETIVQERAAAAEGIVLQEKFMFELNSTHERTFPPSFDWRDQGAVTKVKDQKLCGSCYAMAAIGSIESQYFIKNKKLVEFSEQEIVDCGANYTNFGCAGGISFRVFDYVKEKGLSTASDYPYKGEVGECRATDDRVKINLEGYGFISSYFDSDVLVEAVSSFGPIVVMLDTDHVSFMHYSSGIYYEEECTGEVNHAALLVGYGSENSVDYWLIKNSFGEAWGEAGYIKIARNLGNACGIQKYPIFPILY